MTVEDVYDFICVGGGLGGLAAAIVASDAGWQHAQRRTTL